MYSYMPTYIHSKKFFAKWTFCTEQQSHSELVSRVKISGSKKTRAVSFYIIQAGIKRKNNIFFTSRVANLRPKIEFSGGAFVIAYQNAIPRC